MKIDEIVIWKKTKNILLFHFFKGCFFTIKEHDWCCVIHLNSCLTRAARVADPDRLDPDPTLDYPDPTLDYPDPTLDYPDPTLDYPDRTLD